MILDYLIWPILDLIYRFFWHVQHTRNLAEDVGGTSWSHQERSRRTANTDSCMQQQTVYETRQQFTYAYTNLFVQKNVVSAVLIVLLSLRLLWSGSLWTVTPLSPVALLTETHNTSSTHPFTLLGLFQEVQVKRFSQPVNILSLLSFVYLSLYTKLCNSICRMLLFNNLDFYVKNEFDLLWVRVKILCWHLNCSVKTVFF